MSMQSLKVPVVSINVEPRLIAEGGQPQTLTFTLSEPAPVSGLLVNLRVDDPDGESGDTTFPPEYVTNISNFGQVEENGTITASLRIIEGATNATFGISAVKDNVIEGEETYSLTLLADESYFIDPNNNSTTTTITETPLLIQQDLYFGSNLPKNREVSPEQFQTFIYISNKGFVAGLGEVLRLSLEQDTSFSPEPIYDQVKQYTTMIAADGDPADVYYPVVPDSTADQLPIALMLQGALVDKADYSNYAEEVASYGFVVVVPNNERTLTAPDGQTVTGLFPEQEQVNDVLDQMKVEDADPTSPIFEIADTETLGLLGHSFGGAVGLGATQEEICIPGICSQDYTRPPELKAGIFYGTSFRDQQTGEVLPIDNQEIALGLIQGSLDGVASPVNSQRTYDQILNPPKASITVEGANHYGITNEDNPSREPNRPTLDQTIATGTIARWSGLFLRANLLGDRGAFDYVYHTGDDLDPNVSVISQTP